MNESTKTEATIEPGTVCRLRSGGPAVTVTGPATGGDLSIAWFRADEILTSHVPAAAMVTLEEETRASQKAMRQDEMLRRVHSGLHDLLEAEDRGDLNRKEVLRRAGSALDDLTAELYG